jgi:rhamnosyltransferase
MRILYVGAGYPPKSRGGTEVHMRQLAMAMVARGHDVTVLCRDDDPSRPDFDVLPGEVDGIPVIRLNHRFSETRVLGDVYSTRRIDELVDAELARIEPDLVHVHHLTCLSTSLIDRVKARGIPLVMTLHDFWTVCPRGQRIRGDLDLCTTLDRERCAPCVQDLWPHFRVDAPALRSLDQEILPRLRACDRLFTPSLFHRERMLEINLDPDRVIAVPHGLDHDLVPPRSSWRYPPKKIGFIGSVMPTKGVHVLIDAMNRLGNPEVECHVFGEVLDFHGDKGYGDRLSAQARKDLPFFFHGAYEQADLPRILHDLDVVVVPSLWWETFCLTIREAMLARVPVLASDLGAMHEALADLNLDLLFRPGDGQDLAYKLYALANDESLYRRCSDLRGHVRTLEEMAAETEVQYREVAGHPERRAAHRLELAAIKRKGTGVPYATVFVPTWNGGPLFERVLDKILAQQTDFDYEVLCIDSGSKDGTVDVIKARPAVRLIQIPNHEFNHGMTRNRAVREARGQVVALLTQDAEPYDDRWLQRLVDVFDDVDVAGAFCHQMPREDCNPFQRDRLRGWTVGEGEPVRKRLDQLPLWDRMHPFERYRLIAFDDVASCVRKAVMDEIPFERRQFGEDVTWARAAILAGHTIVMEPRAVVIHSHNNSIFYEFKRVYLDHQNLNNLVGLQSVPTFWHVVKFSFKAWWHLTGVVLRDPRGLLYRFSWILRTPWYSFTQNLAQYLGAQSNLRRREGWFWSRLDARLRKGV